MFFFSPQYSYGFPLDFLIATCQYIAMLCIYCLHPKTKIVNSRSRAKQPTTWRRHSCQQCSKVFSTYEQPDFSFITVQNTANTSSAFSVGKLSYSISQSFAHDKNQAYFASLELANTIAMQLITNQTTTLSNKKLAKTTHEILTRYDKRAAVQYAALHGLL